MLLSNKRVVTQYNHLWSGNILAVMCTSSFLAHSILLNRVWYSLPLLDPSVFGQTFNWFGSVVTVPLWSRPVVTGMSLQIQWSLVFCFFEFDTRYLYSIPQCLGKRSLFFSSLILVTFTQSFSVWVNVQLFFRVWYSLPLLNPSVFG